MSTLLDSISVLVERAKAVGLTQESIDSLLASQVDTLNKIAFCSSFRLGSADDTALVKALNDARTAHLGGGNDATAGDTASFRRLHFEASTMSLAELKMRVERTDDSGPKKIPLAERSNRYNDQVVRLGGLDLTGDLEPSHSLVDLVFQQLEEGVLQYIPLEKCTRRSQELHGQRRESVVKVASGSLAVSSNEVPVSADLSSEYRIRTAMQRRALAYDQTKLAKYSNLMKWVDFLFEQLTRPSLPGYQQVTIDQILQADKRLWLAAAQLTRSGINPVGSPTPLEKAFDDAKSDPQVMMLLLPLPKGSGSSRGGGDERPDKFQRTGFENRKAVFDGKDRKGAGKGKKVGKAPFVKMPAELRGMHYKTKDGQPICFGYNLGSRSTENCSKGKHVCMKPFCYGNHPQSACDKRKRS